MDMDRAQSIGRCGMAYGCDLPLGDSADQLLDVERRLYAPVQRVILQHLLALLQLAQYLNCHTDR